MRALCVHGTWGAVGGEVGGFMGVRTVNRVIIWGWQNFWPAITSRWFHTACMGLTHAARVNVARTRIAQQLPYQPPPPSQHVQRNTYTGACTYN